MIFPVIPGSRRGKLNQLSTSRPMYSTRSNDPPKTAKPSGVSNPTRLRSPASCRSRLAISGTSNRRGLAVNAQPPTRILHVVVLFDREISHVVVRMKLPPIIAVTSIDSPKPATARSAPTTGSMPTKTPARAAPSFFTPMFQNTYDTAVEANARRSEIQTSVLAGSCSGPSSPRGLALTHP